MYFFFCFFAWYIIVLLEKKNNRKQKLNLFLTGLVVARSVNVSTSLVVKISCQKRNNQSGDKMYIEFVISTK